MRRPGYKTVGFFTQKKKVRPIMVRTGPNRVRIPKARALPKEKMVVKVEARPQPKIETTVTANLGQKQAQEIINETKQAFLAFENGIPKSEKNPELKTVDRTMLSKVESKRMQIEPGMLSPSTFDHTIRAQGSQALDRKPGPYDNPIQKANGLAEKRAEVEKEAAALGIRVDKLVMDEFRAKQATIAASVVIPPHKIDNGRLEGGARREDGKIVASVFDKSEYRGPYVETFPDTPEGLKLARNWLDGFKAQDLPSPQAVAAYKEKQETKIERLEAAAEKSEKEARETHDRAEKMADVIPFGQPILVGHYSEKRDRNFRDKIDRTYEKSFELGDKAKKLKESAENAAEPYAINSDDPEAIFKLKQKLAGLIKRRDETKAMTAQQYKKSHPEHHYDEEGKGSFDTEFVRKIYLEADTRNINQVRKRIDDLRATRSIPTKEKVINGVRMHVDQSDNRVKLFFPGIPPEEVRTRLKQKRVPLVPV